MDKHEKYDNLFEKINDYLINTVENFTYDIDYNTWNKYDYDNNSNEYLELVEDISTIMGDILYNNKSKIIIKDMSQVYVFSPDGCISHLISWKYTDELNTILVRYGVFGNVYYIKILIV